MELSRNVKLAQLRIFECRLLWLRRGHCLIFISLSTEIDDGAIKGICYGK